MIMEKNRSKRSIKASREAVEKLSKHFNCTERTVYNAFCFKDANNDLHRKIRYVARRDFGAWIEARIPEDEIFYDTQENGERFMRQYFNNGAVLEVSLKTGLGVVTFKGEQRLRYDKVLLTSIPKIQKLARSMK